MKILLIGILRREIDCEDNVQLFDTAAPVSGETGVFFCQIADQALYQFAAAYKKQKKEGKEGEHFFRKKKEQQVGETVGCRDEHCRYAGQEEKRRGLDMDFLGAVRETGSHGIQRDCE